MVGFEKFLEGEAFLKKLALPSVIEAQKKQLEEAVKVGEMLGAHMATLSEKSMENIKQTMDDAIENVKELSTAKDAEDFMARQKAVATKVSEKAKSQAEELYEMNRQITQSVFELTSKQFADAFESIKKAQAGQCSTGKCKK